MELQTTDHHCNGRSRKANNPIQNNRRPTDGCFLFVFIPIFLIWLGISIHAFSVDRTYSESARNYLNIKKEYVNGPILTFKYTWLLWASAAVSLAAVFLCLYLYKKLTKYFMYLFGAIYILSFISYWANLLLLERPKKIDYTAHEYVVLNRALIISWFCVLPILIYMIISILSFFKVDKTILCQITTNSCRIILGTPWLILCNLLVFIPILVVLSLILNVFYMGTYDMNEDNYFTNHLYFGIVLIGGITVIQALGNFALMVISKYAISHYWKKGEKAPIGDSILTILRYHVGTVLFGSTMFISTLFSIVLAYKHERSHRIRGSYFIYFVTKVSLALAMPEIALIFSSIYGTNFMESYRKTFDTVLRRCTVHLATILVTHAAVAVLSFFSLIPLCAVYVIAAYTNLIHADNMSFSSLLYGSILIFSSFAWLLFSTMKAQLINRIIILNEEDQDTEEKSQTFSRL